jgi:hypothetical protein
VKELETLALLDRRRQEMERRRLARLDATAIVQVGIAAIDEEIVRLGRRLRDRLYPVSDAILPIDARR